MCRNGERSFRGAKAQYVVVCHLAIPNGLRKLSRLVRPYRRKPGVNTANFGRFPQKFSKNTLDRNAGIKRHSPRASNFFLRKNVPTFLPIRAPEKHKSARSTGVCTYRQRCNDEFVGDG